MFAMGAATRIYVATGHTDMRKGFNGLEGLIRSGHIFLFANARRNRLKLTFFDGCGLWVCSRRMEGGTLRWPKEEGDKVQLSREQFALLIGGHRSNPDAARKWYRKASAEESTEARKGA
jgi:transposase